MSFWDYYREEAEVIMERDPAIKEKKEVLLYPSFWAVYKYRKAHALYEKGRFYRARKISQRAAKKTGIEIHPGAQIGKGFFIDHGHGVVIGETTIIGNNVTLYQGVTLGGTGKEKGKRHPTLEDNVMVSVGAKVLGSITIGEGSKIGAGSVVLQDVPPHCTVVGIPGRIVRNENGENPQQTMDQVHLPDPVKDAFRRLEERYNTLSEKVERVEREQRREEAPEKKNDEEEHFRIRIGEEIEDL